MNRVVIVADDFTGACDTGVQFTRGGRRTSFLFDRHAIPKAFETCTALALSTETRYLSAQDAVREVSDFVSVCQQAGGTFFYKKIDSALRGNPGAETEAMLQALGIPAALICPALPALGRDVRDGILRVNGTPLHETSLGQDAFTPVNTSDVAEWFMRQSGLRAGRISIDDLERGREQAIRKVKNLLEAGCTAIVPDAVSDEHLLLLTDILMHSYEPKSELPRLLPVGSAGLGRALSSALAGTPAGTPTGERKPVRPRGRLLAVIGSLNDTAMKQADFAVRNHRYELLSFNVKDALDNPERECGILLNKAASTKGHVLLRGLGRESEITVESGIRVAEVYAHLVTGLCRNQPFSTVFATGGSTAISLARHLGLSSMVLEEELLPGVALGSCCDGNTGVRWFVSKAGSFGDEKTLVSLADTFNP